MEKEFIPYEQALALKELGFDETCFGYYLNENTLFDTPTKNSDFNSKVEDETLVCSSPLYQQVLRWFREEHGLWSQFEYDDIHDDEFDGMYWGINAFKYGIGPIFFLDVYKTLEEAELACIDKFIEIVKK